MLAVIDSPVRSIYLQRLLRKAHMKPVIRHSIVLLLTALFTIGCSSTPDNSDEQRERAKQAQDELSRDTAK